jgi:AcrR family transcriptional regulator
VVAHQHPLAGSPRAESGSARREGFLRSAAAEAAASGIPGVTLAAVARRAGVGRGTLQVAFGSDEGLHRALGSWLMTALIAEGARTA